MSSVIFPSVVGFWVPTGRVLVPIVLLAGSSALAATWWRQPVRSLEPAETPRGDELVGNTSRDGVFWMVAAIVSPTALIAPVVGIGGLLVAYVLSVLRRRRHRFRRDDDLRNGLAEVVDLFAVALAAGHNLFAATGRVAEWAGGEFGRAFGDCVDQVTNGQPLSDSIEALQDRLGPEARPLLTALVAHDRYGAPITQNLAVLAAESRRARRHNAELLARRLPVALLGPLVGCVLPAFLLLTVVPLVAETVASVLGSF